jgi:hypothetical protein
MEIIRKEGCLSWREYNVGRDSMEDNTVREQIRDSVLNGWITQVAMNKLTMLIHRSRTLPNFFNPLSSKNFVFLLKPNSGYL